MEKQLTQTDLKELLHYCPETGVFTWIAPVHGAVLRGAVAGGLDLCGYVAIQIRQKLYKAHRLAFLYMVGEFPEKQVDHINHIRNDNIWSNLRAATSRDNSKNRGISSRNTSGVTGVSWDKSRHKWMVVVISSGRNTTTIGRFKNKNDAVICRKMYEYEKDFHQNHGR